VRVDETHHHFDRRSNSAIAKYADALRRISFAWRISRFSRSSAFILSAISVGIPARLPLSTSAFFTHSFRVWAEQPIFAAIDTIAPSTYYGHLVKRTDPARLSDRARRDAALRPENVRVFEENWRVYGVRKVWRQLDREGFAVARCTIAKLMKSMGIQGIIRGKPHKTTVPDKKAPCPLDKVNRQFRVPAPNMLLM